MSTATTTAQTDLEFLATLTFAEDAPTKLVKAAMEGDPLAFLDRLRKRLPDVDAKDRHWASRWSLEPGTENSRERDLLDVVSGFSRRKPKSRSAAVEDGRVVAKGKASELGLWLADAARTEPLSLLERLTLLDVLRECGRALPLADLWAVLRAVVEAARHPPADLEYAPVDVRLAAEAEWPFVVARTLPWLSTASEREYAGLVGLERELLERTDTDGTPSADVLPRLRCWLAPFARAAVVAEATGGFGWSDEADDRLEALFDFAAAVLRADGSPPFESDASSYVSAVVAGLHAVGASRKSTSLRLAEKVAGLRRNGKGSFRIASDDWPSTQSDWATVSHLRSGWERNADSLVVDHSTNEVRLDLAALGHPLVRGPWELDVRVDDETVRVSEGWECVCWFDDDEVDYLELQYSVDDRLRIERQMLLPRGDQFAVLADTITGPEGVRIDYVSRLPLAEGLTAEADVDSRECRVHAVHQAARVFPAGLPQDRVLSASGRFTVAENSLQLEQSGVGSLHAPLVLDWCPERASSPADWRTLTVTEEGRILPPHLASGHRLRVGGQHQLLLYRSIHAGETARAVLGLHTPRETVIGRVDESGEIETLLLVD